MNIDQELVGFCKNIKIEDGGKSLMATRNQVTGVLTLMKQGLEDDSRETRIDVLKLLAEQAMMDLYNLTVDSTNDLTEAAALYIIRHLKQPFSGPKENDPWMLSEYGRELLSLAEERTQTVAIVNANAAEPY